MSSNMAQSYGVGITDSLIFAPWEAPVVPPIEPSPDSPDSLQDAMLAAKLRERARVAAEAGEEKLAQALREAWEALTVR